MRALDNFKPEYLRTDPFPYFVIPNVLDDDLYEQLSSSFPVDLIISKGISKRGQTRRQKGSKNFNNVRKEIQEKQLYRAPKI